MVENNLSQSEHHVDRIDTSLYKDFTINRNLFKGPYIYTLGNEIRYVCYAIHRNQYKQLRTLLIPLCLESHDRYYFNILIMITLFIICTLSIEYIPWNIKKKEQLSMNLYSKQIKAVSGMMILYRKEDFSKIITF